MRTADIVLSAYNARLFLEAQIESLRHQTHRTWRLWARDDGSTDGTTRLLTDLGRSDERIHVHPPDGRNLGPAGAFSWLLENLPPDARYVFTCDADDVWLPDKVALSLEAMIQAEEKSGGPLLLHTDLRVTDEDLNVRNPSLWDHLGLDLRPLTLRRLMVENVVTGPTVLLNRSMVDRIRPIPREAPYQDWWMALVAAAFGRIVTLEEATVLYRRHGTNITDEVEKREKTTFHLVREMVAIWSRTPELRKWLSISAGQAALFVERFRGDLRPEEVRMMEEYAEIPSLGFFRRKMRVLRHRALRHHGLARNVALLLRA